jgi:hypothetical protein
MVFSRCIHDQNCFKPKETAKIFLIPAFWAPKYLVYQNSPEEVKLSAVALTQLLHVFLAMRIVDIVTCELVVEPENIDGGITVEGLIDELRVFYEAVIPKSVLSGFMTNEESYRRKPVLRDFFLFRMDGGCD